MAPLKIALVGVLGIGLSASLAFADHQPNHQGAGGAPPGYALMLCDINTSEILGDASISGGSDPGIDRPADSCELAIEKFLSVDWRLHLIEPPALVSSGNANRRYYHFVSP